MKLSRLRVKAHDLPIDLSTWPLGQFASGFSEFSTDIKNGFLTSYFWFGSVVDGIIAISVDNKDVIDSRRRLVFFDFVFSPNAKEILLSEIILMPKPDLNVCLGFFMGTKGHNYKLFTLNSIHVKWGASSWWSPFVCGIQPKWPLGIRTPLCKKINKFICL